MLSFRYVQSTLCGLLFSTREFLCTDPRDHIYALLGLASDVETVYKGLSIDYSSPVTTVMHQLCLCNIKEQGTLDFLNIGFPGTYEDPTLPSWVPDVLSPDSGGVRLPFKATRNSALNVELSQNETILTIMGKIIDEVKVLSQPLTTLNDFLQEYGDTFIWQGGILENTEASENLLDEGEIFPSMDAYFEYFKEWLQNCIQIACPSGKVPASATRPGTILSNITVGCFELTYIHCHGASFFREMFLSF
jgi:hypothetical protein